MSQNDPNVPTRRAAAELARSQRRTADSSRILAELDQVFTPLREVGERNHIAWKLKQAIGPRPAYPGESPRE